MHKTILTILLLGVCFGCALGDVKCFLSQLANCTLETGGQTLATPVPGTDLCKNRKAYFDCAREKEKECSTHYNLDEVEMMYDNLCTDGTFLNKLFVKNQECIQASFQNHASCYQDIIDFAKKFKVITPDVIYEITKLTCKERHIITRCLYDFVEKDCGRSAELFMKVVSWPSEKVNKKICRDILRPDQE